MDLTSVKKYRYIPERDLPPLAKSEHIEAILAAIAREDIEVSGLAERSVEIAWKIRIPTFVDAVKQHLQSGKRLFVKTTVKNPKANRHYFSANVGLDPTDTDEELDVYVEIQLSNRVYVIIRDAHKHIDPDPRLPK